MVRYRARPAGGAGVLLSGRRAQWPRLWRAWRWVLLFSLLAALGGSLAGVWRQEDGAPLLDGVLALLDALALGYLLFNRRVRACFSDSAQL